MLLCLVLNFVYCIVLYDTIWLNACYKLILLCYYRCLKCIVQLIVCECAGGWTVCSAVGTLLIVCEYARGDTVVYEGMDGSVRGGGR